MAIQSGPGLAPPAEEPFVEAQEHYDGPGGQTGLLGGEHYLTFAPVGTTHVRLIARSTDMRNGL